MTESEVMAAVNNIGNRKTVVIIAHRLSTVWVCDCIYLLDKGRMVGAGTYDELCAESPKFRAMASGAG